LHLPPDLRNEGRRDRQVAGNCGRPAPIDQQAFDELLANLAERLRSAGKADNIERDICVDATQ
jgi:hypothetical protein